MTTRTRGLARCRRVVCVLFVLGLVGAARPASAEPAPPPSAPPALVQTTAFVFRSEPNDTIGLGQSLTFSPPQWNVTVSRNLANGISVAVTRPPDPGVTYPPEWSLDFSGPGNAPITVGSYPDARRFGFTPFAGFSVLKPGQFCNYMSGRFLVREVAYAANGDVVRLALDLEQHCQNFDPALFAAVRYNSSIGTDMFPGSPPQYSLSVSPSAHGVVTTSGIPGPGIACGGGQSACSLALTTPSTVAVTATPDSGYMFTGWTGACIGDARTFIRLNSTMACRAMFAPILPMSPRTLAAFGNWPGVFGNFYNPSTGYVYSPANSVWQTTALGNNGVSIAIRGIGTYEGADWLLEFRAPAGQALHEGVYSSESPEPVNATLPFTRSPLPVFEAIGDHGRCAGLRVRLDVHQIEFDPRTGAISAFAANFEQSCSSVNSWFNPMKGTVNYRATFEIPCSTPDPFTALGEGVCFRNGWLPPGMNIPGEPVTPPATPPPPPPTGCAIPDPFTSLGGGTCANGGWLPPGMPIPGGSSNPPPPPSPPTGCTTPDPFVSLGGGTCRNGGWLPPGMQ